MHSWAALQSPYYAALSVFVIAAIGLSLYILAKPLCSPINTTIFRRTNMELPGGILGGAYILLINSAPRLGIGNVTVLVLLGQILSALLIDQFGLLRSPVHVLNIQRIIGVILASPAFIL